MEPKLKFSLISAVIAFLSYVFFKHLHRWFNKLMQTKNPHYLDRFPWVFNNKSHTYVFLIMLLKLSVLIVLIWLELIAIPEFMRS